MKKVDLATRVWLPTVTPNIFFQRMPYVLNNFSFDTSDPPKYVLFSRLQEAHKYEKSVRIYFPGEHKKPDWRFHDWAFTFQYDEELRHPRHLRLPNYTRLGAGHDLIKGPNYNTRAIVQSKTKFCAFVYKHEVGLRNSFFKQLSKYKKVDAPGISQHNCPYIGGQQGIKKVLNKKSGKYFYGYYDEKIDYLRDYKFAIVFENESSIGYTSEKIYHAMRANCVPIYWGNPLVHRDFNTKSFVNFHDAKSFSAMIDLIMTIDKNEDLHAKYLSQPWYPSNRLTPYTNPKIILRRLQQIFSS